MVCLVGKDQQAGAFLGTLIRGANETCFLGSLELGSLEGQTILSWLQVGKDQKAQAFLGTLDRDPEIGCAKRPLT